MKLSENTINIFKNFASINPSLLVNAGNVITTMSVNKSIYAMANVEETFTNKFAIYEMSKFLGVISLFKDPEFSFGDKQVKIESGRQSVNYTYADPSMIVAPDPNKSITFPDADVEFSISHDELQRVVRATSVLQLPDIAVIGDGQKITITATNSKNPTTDIFGIQVGDIDKSFAMYFDVSDIIKLISADYNVKISSKGLSQWKSNNVLYYVAMKANSTFTN